MSHPGRDEAESRATLIAALQSGVRMFDTADRYGRGHNERLLGSVLAERAERPIVASKVGFVGSPSGPRPVDGRPETIHAACEASLERLGIERLDLLYLHRLDPGVPVEESVGAMAELVEAGKVARLGLCEVAAPTLERAGAIHPIAALQSEYSLWSRDVEASVLPTCRRLGTDLVAYSPLGGGFLTGRYGSASELPPGSNLARSPRLQEGNLEPNRALVAWLADFARERQTTATKVALAWLAAKGVIAIPGASRCSHLEECLAARELRLDVDDIERLDRRFAPTAVAGARKDEAALALVERH